MKTYVGIDRGRPLGLRLGKIPRFGSLLISEQGGLPYGAAECQLYARIQDPPCFTYPDSNGNSGMQPH
ncbi:hypothetical protein SAMN05216167_112183 [Spirosoma endophyticum]|uniref:Uncharacterized protein n=1 Tax=Spirosoma endophyticum TaxID=662367 RepID=A0A1I1ZPR3_9BACT|nr:hypothetical protein SAMN05216167_112183 [Spirosoma endophyticum]